MNRRRFLVSTAGVTTAAVGVPWLGAAGAATDDELAFANFGASAELLLGDFYSRALAAKTSTGAQTNALRRGRSAAAQHAKALADLLVGAGQIAPVGEDFEFAWPEDAFSGAPTTVSTGLAVLRPVLGAYQTAASSVSVSDYRVLYASLAASVGQQVGALVGPASVEPFPVAVDLETASAALEPYLG